MFYTLDFGNRLPRAPFVVYPAKAEQENGMADRVATHICKRCAYQFEDLQFREAVAC